MPPDESQKRHDDAPPPRQFGLRKLMLWTAVAALWCGTATLPESRAAWCALTAWGIVVALLRIPFGRRGSLWIGTLGVPAVALVAGSIYSILEPPMSYGRTGGVLMTLVLSGVLCFYGLLLSTAINIAVELVDSLDRRLGGKRE